TQLESEITISDNYSRIVCSENRIGALAGHVDHQFYLAEPGQQDGFYLPALNGGALTPTPHAFPNVESDPQYFKPFSDLPRKQRRFDFAPLTPALPAVEREYLYGSLNRKIFDQYLELFADFKYARTFWDSV